MVFVMCVDVAAFYIYTFFVVCCDVAACYIFMFVLFVGCSQYRIMFLYLAVV